MLAQVSGSKLSLDEFSNNSKININTYKSVIESFKKLDLSTSIFLDGENKADWSAIADSIEGCDETALSYFKTLDNGNGTINNQAASIEGLSSHLKSSGQSFGHAATKAALLNTTLNTGILLAASIAIKAIATGLDNYIHRVDNARERTSELFDEFRQMNDTLAEHRKTVSELAGRYDELSIGVNLSNNENISLSSDEYAEFLDINEQLADSFPELTKGIDENGNSILSLGASGTTAKAQLEGLLQTESDLNNFRIAEGLADAFKGVYTYIEDADEATDKLNNSLSVSDESMNLLQDVAVNGITISDDYDRPIFAGNTNNEAELEYMNALTDSVTEFWKSLDGSRRFELSGMDINDATLFTQKFDENTGAFELYSHAYALTADERTELKHMIQDNVSGVSGVLSDPIAARSQKLQEQILRGENAWRDFMSY